MALRDTWHRALVYFGLAEDPDYHEPDLYEPETGTHGATRTAYEGAAPRATVSRLGDRRRGQDEIDDIFSDDAPAPRARALRPVGNGGGTDVRVHLVNPHSFNDAQEVADRFKQNVPDPEPPDHGLRVGQTLDRLCLGSHLRPRRRHAEGRGEDLHAYAAQRRGL